MLASNMDLALKSGGQEELKTKLVETGESGRRQAPRVYAPRTQRYKFEVNHCGAFIRHIETKTGAKNQQRWPNFPAPLWKDKKI